MYLAEGTLLQGGKYKIVSFISAGGFGCTYEAEHVMLHKKVAIKEFFVKDFCNRDETTSQISVGITSKTALVDKLKKKFIEEAQSLCSLDHPNIVHVYDVFEENGTAYYVMNYIDGLSLNDLVKKNGPMSEQKAIGYIKQVADALKYVHSRSRLHLDIKPGNIMVDDKDRAILIDFGASKQYDEEAGENTSTLLGKTPGYAPLEQMGNDVVKFLPSTDIYALGATLYKLLTGITPPSASLLASGEILEDLPSSISTGTRNAIFKSMQINKMKRPQNIDEFIKIFCPVDTNDSTFIEDSESENTIIDGLTSSNVKEEKKTASSKGKQQKEKKAIEKPSATSRKRDKKSTRSSSKRKISCMIIGAVVVLIFIIILGSNQYSNGVTQPIYDEVTNQNYEHKGESVSYSGAVKDGIPHGKGIGIYPHGKYEGEYLEGARHGKGKFTDKEGGVFTGTFANDEYYNGKYVMKDGTYYEGTFQNQQPYNGMWYEQKGSVIGYVNDGVFSEPKTTKKNTTVTKQSEKKEYVPYQQIRKERYKSKHAYATYD